MVNTNLILGAALRNNYYSRQLGPYIVPTFVISNVDGKRINLVGNRNAELERLDSSYVKMFKADIKDVVEKMKETSSTRYIEEFPVVIDNRDMWNRILDHYGVSTYNKIRRRQYFLLDFLFYELGFAVEIDSDFHNGRELYDKARDHYLQSRYGLETVRYYKYGSKRVKREKYIDKITEMIKKYCQKNISTYSLGRFLYIDQTYTIYNNYIIDNKGLLEFINNLLVYTKSTDITREIAITMKDVSRISPNNLGIVYCDPMMRQDFLDNVVFMMWNMFRIKLHIHNTTEYSLYDVLWILDFNKSPNKWQNFILQTNCRVVPNWICDIMEIPKELENYISIDPSSAKDSGIHEFLQVLGRRI